VFDISELVVNP